MHFHGPEGNAHIGRDLLVQAAADDVVHYFALPRGQTGQAGHDFLAFPLPDTGRRVARDRIPYRFKQNRIVDGFLQKVHCAFLHRSDARGDIAVRGQKNNGKGETSIGEKVVKLRAGHAGDWQLD